MMYKKLLTAAKDIVDEIKADLHTKEMQKKGELEAIKIETSIAEAESKLAELKSAYPLDYAKILENVDSVELLKRKLRKLEEVLTELFPKV